MNVTVYVETFEDLVELVKTKKVTMGGQGRECNELVELYDFCGQDRDKLVKFLFSGQKLVKFDMILHWIWQQYEENCEKYPKGDIRRDPYNWLTQILMQKYIDGKVKQKFSLDTVLAFAKRGTKNGNADSFSFEFLVQVLNNGSIKFLKRVKDTDEKLPFFLLYKRYYGSYEFLCKIVARLKNKKIPKMLKYTKFIKMYVVKQIIEICIGLKILDLPFLVMFAIVRKALDITMFTENQVMLLIINVVENRKLSAMERNTLLTEKETNFKKEEKFMMELYLNKGIHTEQRRKIRAENLKNVSDALYIDVMTHYPLDQRAGQYKYYRNKLAFRQWDLKNSDGLDW